MNDNIDNLFSKVEQLQKDYYSIVNSKAFRIGTKMVSLMDSIKQHRLIQYIHKEYIYRKNARHSVFKEASDFNYGAYPSAELKFAVYSCITGGYDNLAEPFFNIDGIDYIMFTDNVWLTSEKWQIRPIPAEILSLKDNIQINRYIKMHPGVVGEEYDFALYVDGNICIVSNIKNMINAISPQVGFALHQHSSRDCIYSEVQACKNVKRGNIEKLTAQANRYRKAGFPEHCGLLEATVILTDLHNPTALSLQDKWWQEFIVSESRRDQIALPYVLWSNHVEINDVGSLGCPIQRNPKFRKFDHK